MINSTEMYSIGLSSVFILFELLKDKNSDNYVTPKDDNNMIAIASYTFHIMIYGNGSDTCSQYLRATFKQPQIAQELRENGIYIRNIDSGETINEFINNTLLLRCDLNVSLEVAYVLQNLTQQEYFKHEDLTPDDTAIIINEV